MRDLILKLNLHFSQVASLMNSAHGPIKKNTTAGKRAKRTSQTHTKMI